MLQIMYFIISFSRETHKIWVRVLVFNVSFIGGRNWSTRRKPPTCCKSATKFIIYNVVSKTPRHEWDSNKNIISNYKKIVFLPVNQIEFLNSWIA